MTGVRMTFTLRDLAIRNELRHYERPKDTEAFLRNIGEEFASAGGVISQRFQDETGPEGRWAPLSPVTIDRRLKRYGNRPITILRMEGEA